MYTHAKRKKRQAGPPLLSNGIAHFFTLFLIVGSANTSIMSAAGSTARNALYGFQWQTGNQSSTGAKGGALPNLHMSCFSVSFERISVFRDISGLICSLCGKVHTWKQHIFSKHVTKLSDALGTVLGREGGRELFPRRQFAETFPFLFCGLGERGSKSQIAGGSLLFWSPLVCQPCNAE